MLLSAIFVALPSHMLELEGVAVTSGIGFTVITAVVDAEQLLAVPVIVYVAVPAVALLLLAKVCDIGVPVPELPPLMPAA